MAAHELTPSPKLPTHASVVVIGGGVVGCATAYHLAQLGVTDTVLIERARLGSGTTWHAAGNMETYREDPLLGEMIAYAVDLYPRLEAETGQALGWRQTGRVTFTTDARRFAQYRGLPAVGEARGIEIELLTPAGVEAKLPIINPAGLAGGIWVPSDGRINPTDLAVALAKGARRRGVRIVENTPVLRILTERGHVTGVETAETTLRCDAVVIAAGLWSSALGRTCGAALPLHAVEHFYFLTEPLEPIWRDMPLFLSYDELMYGREDVGGLLFGFLDRDAVPVGPESLPGDFAFELLAENWAQAEPYLDTAITRFPLLETAGIRMLLNGPESFTPDGNMLLGPVPGVRGLHVAAGMNSNGIALSAGAGKLTAEWILQGQPSLDASRLEVRRFAAAQSTDRFIRARVSEVPSHFGVWPEAGHDYQTGRGMRRSPIYEWQRRNGARFVTSFGWERAEWFDTAASPIEACVAAELDAMQTGTALVDASSDTKLEIRGPDLSRFIRRVAAGLVLDEARPVVPALILNERGGLVADPLLVRTADAGVLLVAGAELEVRLHDELITALQRSTERVSIVACGAAWSRVELFGAGVAALIEALGGPDIAGRTEELHPVEIGYGNATLVFDPRYRLWSLLFPSEFAASIVGALEALNPALKPGGWLARERWRIGAGLPRWGADFTPAVNVLEAGLDDRAHLDTVDFIGREALNALANNPPTRRLRSFCLRPSAELPEALTPVWQAGKVVGHITSVARTGAGKNAVVLALVEDATGAPLSINVAGAWVVLTRAA